MMMKWISNFFADKERWAVNCDFHNWTLQDLTRREAQVVLETLRDSEKSSVLIWKTGWPAWRTLRDAECATLLETRIVSLNAPPLPNGDDFDPEITAVRSVAKDQPFATRKYNRVNVELPVKFVSSQNEFQTFTVDMSLGGMKVKDALPAWVAGYVTAIIQVAPGQEFEVMCSIAEDQKNAKTRLEFVPSEKLEKFTQWFQTFAVG